MYSIQTKTPTFENAFSKFTLKTKAYKAKCYINQGRPISQRQSQKDSCPKALHAPHTCNTLTVKNLNINPDSKFKSALIC